MFKQSHLIAALTAASIISAVPASVSAAPGYRTATLEVQHRTKPLDLHIWYPADQTAKAIKLGKNAVFTGVEVRPEAPSTPGKHPLVLLSHGSGGNAVNIAWIAAELADRGMVVVATNHHGTTSNDSHPDQTVKVWERPADLTAILNKAVEDGLNGIRIDASNIGAIGFSLGGHSVLSLAGARVKKARYIDYCNQHAGMHDCGWLAKGGVDFTKIDAKPFEQSNKDLRFKTIVAVDPALALAYDHSSLSDISTPVQLINLGQGKEVPAAINAIEISGKIGNAQLTNIKQATHFSFLGECTMVGALIIAGVGEDPICSETGNRKRADIHAELKSKIGNFLTDQLMSN